MYSQRRRAFTDTLRAATLYCNSVLANIIGVMVKVTREPMSVAVKAPCVSETRFTEAVGSVEKRGPRLSRAPPTVHCCLVPL